MKRYDFVYLFDVTDGNPNGDPDAGNLPRVDPETGHGLVTDVCLKRKVRNYVGLVKKEQPPYEIYVKEKAVLNKQHERAYVALGKDSKKAKQPDVNEARDWMCKNFFDIRAFGAVMSTGDFKCGQVRGPIQLAFARSIDPVVALEHAVTRCAVTTEKEAEKQSGDNRTMGRKFTLSYGLYRCHGFINPFLAEQTDFGEEDLTLFWKALENAFEFDRSAARGQMAARALIVFEHKSPLGNGHAHQLQNRVKVTTNTTGQPIRKFEDYDIKVDKDDVPDGITINHLF